METIVRKAYEQAKRLVDFWPDIDDREKIKIIREAVGKHEAQGLIAVMALHNAKASLVQVQVVNGLTKLFINMEPQWI